MAWVVTDIVYGKAVINSSSFRFRRLFLCAFIDCLALMMVFYCCLLYIWFYCWLFDFLYLYDIDFIGDT